MRTVPKKQVHARKQAISIKMYQFCQEEWLKIQPEGHTLSIKVKTQVHSVHRRQDWGTNSKLYLNTSEWNTKIKSSGKPKTIYKDKSQRINKRASTKCKQKQYCCNFLSAAGDFSFLLDRGNWAMHCITAAVCTVDLRACNCSEMTPSDFPVSFKSILCSFRSMLSSRLSHCRVCDWV